MVEEEDVRGLAVGGQCLFVLPLLNEDIAKVKENSWDRGEGRGERGEGRGERGEGRGERGEGRGERGKGKGEMERKRYGKDVKETRAKKMVHGVLMERAEKGEDTKTFVSVRS